MSANPKKDPVMAVLEMMQSVAQDVKDIGARLNSVEDQVKETKLTVANRPAENTASSSTNIVAPKRRGRPPKIRPVPDALPLPPSPTDASLDIVTRLRLVLETGESETSEIAKVLKMPLTLVEQRLRQLHDDDKVTNLGGDLPIWVWKVGASASPAERFAMLIVVLKRRPMETKEMMIVTGMDERQVQNAIVEVRRSPEKLGGVLKDYGMGRTRMYFIEPNAVKDPAMPKKPR